MNNYRVRFWMATMVIATLCGCAQQLTYHNYQTLSDGASREQVRHTLGEPWEQMNNKWIYQDFDRQITAFIWFDGDEVVGRYWREREFETGGSPHVNTAGDAESTRVEKTR